MARADPSNLINRIWYDRAGRGVLAAEARAFVAVHFELPRLLGLDDDALLAQPLLGDGDDFLAEHPSAGRVVRNALTVLHLLVVRHVVSPYQSPMMRRALSS